MLFQRKALQVLSGGMGYAFGRKGCILDGGGEAVFKTLYL